MLLLDEPTNNLDPASREEILGALAHYEAPWCSSRTTRAPFRR
jgi:energy-coupling factor transporter ATP-binding protein EcfA2